MLTVFVRRVGARGVRSCCSAVRIGGIQSVDTPTRSQAQPFLSPEHDGSSATKHWSSLQATPFRIAELSTLGTDAKKRLEHSGFLHRELCIRFAHGVAHLRSFPRDLIADGPFQQIVEVYNSSIEELEACPVPQTPAEAAQFLAVIRRIYDMQQTVGSVSDILQGAVKLSGEGRNDQQVAISPESNAVLTSFFTSRTALRFLMKNYIDSYQPGGAGILQARCSPFLEARKAARESTALCRETMGRAPTIQVRGDVAETLEYVPSVLRYMLVEVLKNSCRAVMERHAQAGSDAALPAIHCEIENSGDAMVIKIRDAGGGMPSRVQERIWDFLYTSCSETAWTHSNASTSEKQWSCPAQRPQTDLAGFGIGLPLSRMYARYFGGGDLEASSTEGVGTEVRINLSRSASRCEVLPSFCP